MGQRLRLQQNEHPRAPPPAADLPRIPTTLLIIVNGFLVLVAHAVLIGIWTARTI
jgi:inner membrane protein YidH